MFYRLNDTEVSIEVLFDIEAQLNATVLESQSWKDGHKRLFNKHIQ